MNVKSDDDERIESERIFITYLYIRKNSHDDTRQKQHIIVSFFVCVYFGGGGGVC